MSAAHKACPKCQGPMRISFSRMGRWICLACDHVHDELPEDENTWLERWEPQEAGELA